MLVETRVVEVFDPHSRTVGSGYLVADGLVLTARHVVDGSVGDTLRPPAAPRTSQDAPDTKACDRRCRIRPLDRTGQSRFVDAVPVWWSWSIDAALILAIDQLSHGGELEPMSWADLLTADLVEVTAVGFPNADVEGNLRESRQLWGAITPLTGVKQGRWSVQMQARVGVSHPDSTSVWAGMSGAAIFADDELVGIITVDPNPANPELAELWALPARRFAEEPDLLSWIEWCGGPNAFTRSDATPVGSYRALRNLVESNARLPVLDGQTIERLSSALTMLPRAQDDQTTRRAIGRLLAMMRSKNVLRADIHEELWPYVFASLRELRESLIEVDTELLVTGPSSVESVADAMLTAVRNYLGRHETSFQRHMQSGDGNWHWQFEWPGLSQAGIELLALREAIAALVPPLNDYAYEPLLAPSGSDWDFRAAELRSALPPGRTNDQIRPTPFSRLVEVLSGEVRSARIAAVDELAQHTGSDARQLLIDLLEDEDAAVSGRAALALTTTEMLAPQPGDIERLVGVASHGGQEATTALRLLAPYAGHPLVAPLLVSAVADGIVIDEATIRRVLQRDSGADADRLLGLLEDRSPDWIAAAFAEGPSVMRKAILAKLFGAEYIFSFKSSTRVFEKELRESAQARRYHDGPIHDVLIAALDDEDAVLRYRALRAVWLAYGCKAEAVLIVAAADSEPAVRGRATYLLGGCKSHAALRTALAGLSDPHPRVRAAAADALAALADELHVPTAPLLHTLTDSTDSVRWAALEALALLRAPEGLDAEPILACIDDSDETVRRAAMALASEWRVASAVPRLRERALASGSEWMSRLALEAVIRIDGDAGATIIAEAMTSQDVDVREAAQHVAADVE